MRKRVNVVVFFLFWHSKAPRACQPVCSATVYL